MIHVLFVCLGNICRSPSAEAVFQKYVDDKGLSDKFVIDSAGTSAYHSGEPADSRSITHAEKRGYSVTSLSRPFLPESDFEKFDYILTMDKSNYRNVLAADNSQAHQEKVKQFADYCVSGMITEVPDPYAEGPDGFELVLDILEDGCTQLLEEISKEASL